MAVFRLGFLGLGPGSIPVMQAPGACAPSPNAEPATQFTPPACFFVGVMRGAASCIGRNRSGLPPSQVRDADGIARGHHGDSLQLEGRSSRPRVEEDDESDR